MNCLFFPSLQIKREISIMKLVRHPNVVRLHEVRCYLVSLYKDCLT
jgi:serine/threonine protein kinase